MRYRNYLLIFFVCCCFRVAAQGSKSLDSLRTAVRTLEKQGPSYTRDIQLLRVYNRLGLLLYTIEPKQARLYAEKGLKFARQYQLPDFEATGLLVVGNCLLREGAPEKARNNLQQCLNLAEKADLKNEKAGAYLAIGNSYKVQGSFSAANEHYQRALKLFKELNQDEAVATVYTNIGDCFWQQKDYPTALENLQKALAINEELGNKENISINLNNISSIFFSQHYYAQALEYAQKALALNEDLGNSAVIAQSCSNIGDIYSALGNTAQAVDFYRQALDALEGHNRQDDQVATYLKVGDLYMDQENFVLALENYQKGIKIGKSVAPTEDYAQCLYNMGDIYQRLSNYSSALDFYQNTLKVSEKLGSKRLINYTCIKIGQIYSKQGKQDQAIDWLQKGARMAAKLGGNNELGVAKTDLINAYIAQGNYKQAEKYLKQGWSIVQDRGDKSLKRDYAGSYSDWAAKTGDWKKAYEYQKISRANADSLALEESIRQEMEFRFRKAEDSLKVVQAFEKTTFESALLAARIKTYAALGGIVLVMAGMVLLFRQRQKTRKALLRSDELLLNILPNQVAVELKETGLSTAKRYESCTVLFADIKDFTKISEEIGALELVAQMDVFFRAFDRILSKHNVEKIKTIGDAYMCAGGIPASNTTHAKDVINVALEMKKFIEEQNSQSDNRFEFRIGVHTGPVVAGIVGLKKFAYDIWGDTVNTAARMEQNGEAGEINISGSTYELIREDFICEHRGIVKVKGKGALEMYFVKAVGKEADVANYENVRDFILAKLDKELPKNLYYHGLHHTLDVLLAADKLAEAEGVSPYEQMLLRTAVLFHDSGYIDAYHHHEDQGCVLAKEHLSSFGYSAEEIERICGMIMATKIPQSPKNRLEEIICDADLDYLGREDFWETGTLLYQEFVEHQLVSDINTWNEKQVSFLEKHRYFTRSAQAWRNEKKESYLQEVKELVAQHQ